jgi:hypothetical protein
MSEYKPDHVPDLSREDLERVAKDGLEMRRDLERRMKAMASGPESALFRECAYWRGLCTDLLEALEELISGHPDAAL